MAFFGKPQKFEQLPTYSPGQQNIQSQLQQGLGGNIGSIFEYLQNMLSGNSQGQSANEARARRDFSEQTLPGIAERFTGTFGEGSQRSNAFGQQLGQAGAALEENLAANRDQSQMQALQQLMQLLSQSQAPEFQTVNRPATGGLIGGGLEALGKGGGLGLGLGAPDGLQAILRLLGLGG